MNNFEKVLQSELLKSKKRIKVINQLLVDCKIVNYNQATILKRKTEENEMLRERLKIPFRLVGSHDIREIK